MTLSPKPIFHGGVVDPLLMSCLQLKRSVRIRQRVKSRLPGTHRALATHTLYPTLASTWDGASNNTITNPMHERHDSLTE